MPALLLAPLYLALVLAPLGLAWAADLPPRPALDDLSSGLALAAFAALLIEFLLSGRFRFVSNRIGLDVTMRMHQLFARTVLALALVHPFLYTLPQTDAFPPWDPTGARHVSLGGWGLIAGALAWIGLGALVLTGIARDRLPYRYEGWRLCHGLGAAAVAGFGAWHVFAVGRYSAEPLLFGFWIGLLALAGLSLLWVYLLAPLTRRGRPYAVTSVRPVADAIREVTVAPKGPGRISYKAGQFGWLALRRSPFGVRDNPFSFASAPASGDAISFVIKEAGDFTGALDRVTPGDPAWIDGPHGALTAPPEAQGVGLIAGGVGIAPLLGVLREMRATGDRRPARLLYGAGALSDVVYRDELAALDRDGATTIRIALERPPEGWDGLTGRIDARAVALVFGDEAARDWTFLLCGPPGMLEAAERALRALGAPDRRIRAERFVYD
jgi:predicted ferric reductase